MLGQNDTEQRRMRVGLLLLAIGVILLLWAWGSWLFRTSVPAQPPPAIPGTSWTFLPSAYATQADDGDVSDERRSVARVSLIMMTFLLILIVVLFGGYAVIIASRRYHELMQRKKAAPTPNEDVWAMHRLPEDE